MTFEEIAQMIDGVGLPNAYYQFFENEVPALPYVIFYYPNSNNYVADDKVYKQVTSLNIELYSKNKDVELESQLESYLNDNNLVWEKSESYIDSEHMYEVLYESEVVIDG